MHPASVKPFTSEPPGDWTPGGVRSYEAARAGHRALFQKMTLTCTAMRADRLVVQTSESGWASFWQGTPVQALMIWIERVAVTYSNDSLHWQSANLL